MKLYEEFKLVEDLWDNEEYAELMTGTDDKPEGDPVIRTFGRKTYNLANINELFAWWRANLEFQMKRYPDKYTGYRGRINNSKLHVTIANNLIAKLKADGVTNENIFKELQLMAGGNSYMAASDEAKYNKAKSLMYDVAAAELGDLRKVPWDKLTAIVEKATDSFLSELESLYKYMSV